MDFKMTDIPKISVIVPVYKVEAYLKQCVDSIINQTYSNLEIILVDDGSPDGCGEICEDYAAKDGRVKVIHKQNGGHSDARNAGIDTATGEWIGFVDSDDWIEPSMYEKLLNAAISSKAALAYCGYTRWEYDGDRSVHIWNEKYNDNMLIGYFSGDITIPHVCMLYHKSLLQGDNPVRYEGNLHCAEDIVFIVKVLKKHQNNSVAYVPEALYNYCNRRSGIVLFETREERLQHLAAYDRILSLVEYSDKVKEAAEIFCVYSITGYMKSAVVLNNKIVAKDYRNKLRSYLPRFIKLNNIDFKNKFACALYAVSPKLITAISIRMRKKRNSCKV